MLSLRGSKTSNTSGMGPFLEGNNNMVGCVWDLAHPLAQINSNPPHPQRYMAQWPGPGRTRCARGLGPEIFGPQNLEIDAWEMCRRILCWPAKNKTKWSIFFPSSKSNTFSCPTPIAFIIDRPKPIALQQGWYQWSMSPLGPQIYPTFIERRIAMSPHPARRNKFDNRLQDSCLNHQSHIPIPIGLLLETLFERMHS